MQWSEIEHEFDDVILLGNGSSMAIDNRFGYGSLRKHSIEKGLLTGDVQTIFNYLHTADFELILRIVWHATNVNKSLGVEDEKTEKAYQHVRDCLISSVRSIHPEYDEVSGQLPLVYKFLKGFNRVFSLNYDLLVYWAMMYGWSIPDHHAFKDCFVKAKFIDGWNKFEEPIRDEHKCTLVFYPHGNIILARDKIENERKLSAHGDNLLDQVLDRWEAGSYVPLFVSEGTFEQKEKSIQSSFYLSTVFREVLSDISTTLVVYGWSFGEQDSHILERIAKSGVKKLAISVREENQEYCNRVNQIILDNFAKGVEIQFFDSASAGCWNNPTD